MECVIWEFSVYRNQLFVRHDESSSRTQQSFRQGKGVCYHFCSEIYGLQEQMGITQRALKIRTIEPVGLFKGEDISVDVQELAESIENMNAKMPSTRCLQQAKLLDGKTTLNVLSLLLHIIQIRLFPGTHWLRGQGVNVPWESSCQQ